MSQKHAGGSEEGKGFQLRKNPVITTPEDGAKPSSNDPKPINASASDLDRLGDLPHSYGSDTLFLIAQEPRWLFTYWDIDISRHPGGQAHLRVYLGDVLEAEIEVPFESRNWYIPVKEAGGLYAVEIGYYRGQDWKPIARSIPVQTPPDKFSASESFDFASIPLHLSFEKLTENVQAAIRSGESLMHALSRLQRDGNFQQFGNFPGLTVGQRVVLEALLGTDFLAELTSGGFGSEEIEARIQTFLTEKLSSAGSSETLSSEIFQSAGLSSSFLGGHSWDVAALSSWTTEALMSWTASAGAGASWGDTSSWSGVSSESWLAETLGSWNQSMGSSWNTTELSSWLQGIQSSWSTAALSSWNESALTSWSEAAVTSWSGGSESLSSFGQSREFFMHVNAEVIFYGGTDPRAKVSVNGKPIQLNPDGSFRYHFIFPDGTYEIPIVAVSPDGVETRSAILRFERGTEKRGGVDDTAQPPLDVPMGERR